MDSSSLIEGSLSDRITKRDRERKNVIERRREERQQLAVDSEQSSYFKDAFYASCKQVKDMLNDALTAPTSALPGIFDKANKEIQTLKNYLSQSKMFLKMYDIRRAQENLQLLENEASELELKLLPKKKFGFKARRAVKKPIEKVHDVTDGLKDLKISEGIVNGTTKQNNKLSSKYGDSAYTVMGKVDDQLVLDAENVNKNDVLLSDLLRCTVRIYGTPSTLHMINLKQCTILVGPVASSVFIHDCTECQFAFACQQLRLHSSTDCTIYLHVTSRAIIEDCTKIRVAPYNWTYEDQTSHFNLAGLDPKVNNWNCVDDFNWLSSEKHSPNWSILEPEFRVKSWD
ncbi:tubulin-specific chaperone C [Cephus cinctus]|uniref:Tubulin-specific chaperone C n=1 Tax=Cephus cinctus TaxID=211228 RepID=A0AAJ7CCZ6_CEPCN|nr:tubulin-specific chaperone C [Cephus cinctus]XP_015607523.1 tubulin-specific chaperone C [Cephus cinctus]XP_015607524.1 tubulin-specific chaperone C [Cephus cinctus]XP_024946759.1 tubulin-specific chaperone C [Cephus cinctus]XP_024946760.1 tubulin-specific chaperone C [Cephus cinctus]XP_024946761.1 tubulin-specific chaperone C [Cephus cinctus]